ncbi:alpha/beta hydrolase-fold protein [Microbulbifer sp. OS29]|uniref:Alpha/beta hydrolase-fold protein n=1 Tax=Microbulbifer okhotskensis TaxID=2926617 RepID=A0A9X2ESB3_9GAMM|nr:alpha/beta hydrolase-fold protein [Microbulbifer okhotskensis]MCO1334713.1 alpha/beta hydrolase-fold protein [Microbulbifer okhotskensis]
MIKFFVFFIFLSHVSDFVCAMDFERAPLVVGDSIKFSSKVLNEDRRLNIYLPESYQRSSKRNYPVIYLLDGAISEDFVHIAGVLQFGSFSWVNMVPESILVGVVNVDRKRDFTFPSTKSLDKKEFPSSGGSSKFIEFLGRELQPLIESNYRVNGESTLIGQSLGGLVATEILFKHSALFDNYIIISPSLWWSGELLMTDSAEECCDDKLIYIGVGREGEVMERLARTLFNKLDNEKNKTEVHFGYFKQLDHGDTLHLAVYDAFEKLFSAKSAREK